MTDREAMQMALDAWDSPMGMIDLCVVMDALRARLEQPEQPEQRKPLTDEEIWEIHDACIPPTEGYVSPVEFARAIEQAHGIKETP